MSIPFPWMTPIGSEHGPAIDHLMWLVHILMAVLFIGWGALFVYMLIRFRRGRNPRADYHGTRSHASRWGEAAVAVAEGVLLIGFSIPLWHQRVGAEPRPDDALTVDVIAEQFAWNIHYPGPDGVIGRREPELVDLQINPVGLDPDDPYGEDDVVVLNQLHLPVDEPVVVRLSSKDVIHSFYLPEMRVKQDAIPGLQIPLWFTPTLTTAEMREQIGDEDFQYELACAQLCGLTHYNMRGILTVETREEFDAWIASRLSG